MGCSSGRFSAAFEKCGRFVMRREACWMFGGGLPIDKVLRCAGVVVVLAIGAERKFADDRGGDDDVFS